jgi:hypothetical protein
MNVDTDDLTMQRVMNEAYAEWGDASSQAAFYEKWKDNHVRLMAVVMGNLNYQVENGGWVQWADNQYAEAARPYIFDLLSALNTDNARTVEGFVRQVYREMRNEKDFDRYHQRSGSWLSDHWNEDDYYDWNLEGADTAYYAISDAFMLEVNAYIEQKLKVF